MNKKEILDQLFKSIDQSNTEAFVSLLTDKVQFRFGNASQLSSKEDVKTTISGFFTSIKSLSHSIINVWEIDDVAIIQGEVTYTRHDESTLTVPFTNIFEFTGDLISKYLIYVDISELYKTS